MMRINPYSSALWLAGVVPAFGVGFVYVLLAQLLIVAAWADAGWP